MCISFLKYYIFFIITIFSYIWKLIYDIWYMIYDILYVCVYIHHIIWYHILSCHIIQNLIISYPFISYHIIWFCITHIYISLSHVRYIIYTIHYTIYNRYLKVTVLHTNKGPQYYAGLGAGNDRWKSCPRWKRHPRLMPEAKPFFLAVYWQ